MKARRKILALFAIIIAIIVIVPSAIAAGGTTLADFEGGAPGGWFVFNGGASSVSTTTQIIADADALARPDQVGNNEILNVTFSVGDYGGLGDSFIDLGATQDWSNYESFNFWFYGTGSGLTYQAEISDNRSDPGSDTSERFDYAFTDNSAGWQFISIPFADFTRATDFQPGGAPDDGFTLTEIYAWAIVLPWGADTVYMDDVFLGHTIVDDFESGLPAGTDGDGIDIGFTTFNDPGSSVAISTTNTPPAPVPDSSAGNHVFQIDTNVNDSFGYAGAVHAFANGAVDTWAPQDWSRYQGFSFWLYGNNTGKTLFIDILDNRNPGSTSDDAERFSIDLGDDFSGWQFIEIPFADFNRKEVGNGAPNDGFNLTEVHGWAFGVFNAGVPFSNYIDNVGLYGIADIPELTVAYSADKYETGEGNTAVISVKLNRELGIDDADPDAVSINYATESGSAVADRDYTPVTGTLTFTDGGPAEQTFNVETFDNNKYDGNKTVILRLSDPVDVTTGFVTQAVLSISGDEEYDPNLLDDFERGTYLWDSMHVNLTTPEITADDSMAVPGQGDYEHVLAVETAVMVDIAQNDHICNGGNGVIPVAILTTDSFDALSVDHNSVQFGDTTETHVHKATGDAQRHEEDFDGDGDVDLVFHFRANETGYDCDDTTFTLTGETYNGQMILSGAKASFARDFAIGQDWTKAEALTFWVYGTNSGDEIVVNLKDNRAPDPSV